MFPPMICSFSRLTRFVNIQPNVLPFASRRVRPQRSASGIQLGASMGAAICVLAVAAPSRAIVVSVNVTSAGSNSLNISGRMAEWV